MRSTTVAVTETLSAQEMLGLPGEPGGSDDDPAHPRAVATAAGLTEREHAVLVGLAEGFEVKQIARQMGITVNTCRGYVRSVRNKFGVHTQLAAVVRAAHEGMLPNLHGRPTTEPLAPGSPPLAPVTLRVRDLYEALDWRGLVPETDPELDQLGAAVDDLTCLAEELARRNLELARTNEELRAALQAARPPAPRVPSGGPPSGR
jgi:DNA-binding CsgD family transcriptional regulator